MLMLDEFAFREKWFASVKFAGTDRVPRKRNKAGVSKFD